MKWADMLLYLASGLFLLSSGFVLGRTLEKYRWQKVTGCRLEYHEIPSTNWYEAVSIGKGAE